LVINGDKLDLNLTKLLNPFTEVYNSNEYSWTSKNYCCLTDSHCPIQSVIVSKF